MTYKYKTHILQLESLQNDMQFEFYVLFIITMTVTSVHTRVLLNGCGNKRTVRVSEE